MKLLIFLTILAVSSAWLAHYSATTVEGAVKVLDGDSLMVGGREIRLLGIDAPEYRQECAETETSAAKFACGKMARKYLNSLTTSQQVTCTGNETDKYDRLLAVCTAGDVELNREMVLRGWAVSFGDYEHEEAVAKQNSAGVWRGVFVRPENWRRIDQEKHTSGWLGKLFMW